eukprot:CAMPEP_0182868204 /NCGR_PEP_ID=MMETSP0034_2-20130328/9171_1 /TAXON_ID=156128 /ORGANISM="Nephroselmis pyriformis, Strain CCMP717" /LENGTH=359 /DNA_ID=CAMNT_0025000597 /DNA_START=229 /DNA_END=1304 /DNA_ORIENTATION=-
MDSVDSTPSGTPFKAASYPANGSRATPGLKLALHGAREGVDLLGVTFQGGLSMGRELAEVLIDLAPHLLSAQSSHRNLDVSYGSARSHRKHLRGSKLSLKVRLSRAIPAEVGGAVGDFSHLSHVAKTEDLNDLPSELAEPAVVEVNSGGAVFFLFFKGDPCAAGGGIKPPAPAQAEEYVACVKFAASRLDAQAELFGAELAGQLGVTAPATRILYSNSPEFASLRAGAARAGGGRASAAADAGCAPELSDWLADAPCVLLMSYVRGAPLKAPAFQDAVVKTTAEQLGGVLALDMILANADRLPFAGLGWRGNAGNLLYVREGGAGQSLGGAGAGCLHAIDSGIPRRLPGMRMRSEAAKL